MDEQEGHVFPEDRSYDGGTVIVLRTFLYGLGIGTAWGALSGTLLAPVIGTFFGAVGGFVVAVIPTLLGALAILISGRPGTSQEVYGRRVRRITGTIGMLFLVIGLAAAGVRAAQGWDKTEAYVFGAVIVGGLLGLFLLLGAAKRLAELRPAPAGTRDGTAWGVLAVAFATFAFFSAPAVWSTWLGPGPQHKREVAAIRADYTEILGAAPYGGRFNWGRPSGVGASDDDCSDHVLWYRAGGGGAWDEPEAATLARLDRLVDVVERSGITLEQSTEPPRAVIVEGRTRTERFFAVVYLRGKYGSESTMSFSVSRAFPC